MEALGMPREILVQAVKPEAGEMLNFSAALHRFQRGGLLGPATASSRGMVTGCRPD
jgi:hypothetical protein